MLKKTLSLGGLYYPIGKKIVEIINETKKSIEEKEKNFYIVIDEINRGNISKIFGELITLIEEDKRDAYEVTLPYSKEKFKIPSNLYIIATMNSTDKSIATIDIALRRRFTFLKMKPKEELVKNEKAKDLMKELNNHIKETIGKDYQLGHSYFMKIENEYDLEFVKEYKIKPLLEEYFYGDEDNYNIAENILYGRTNK
jgi:5-methylcytosine-specific restriction enzyme B